MITVAITKMEKISLILLKPVGTRLYKLLSNPFHTYGMTQVQAFKYGTTTNFRIFSYITASGNLNHNPMPALFS